MDIEEVRRLRDAYEAVLDDAEVARSAYHRAVRKLHASGVPLREIADGLGISHQRVHQIVTPADATRARPKRAATGAIIASVLAIVLIAGTIGVLTRDRAPVPRPVEPSATAAPVADGPRRLACDRFEEIFEGQPAVLQNVSCATRPKHGYVERRQSSTRRQATSSRSLLAIELVRPPSDRHESDAVR